MLFPSFHIYTLRNKLKASPTNSKIEIGYYGEQLAALYLKQKKYKILQHNYRIKRWGEVDIVTATKDQVVLVEVKTRIGEQKTNPTTAIHEKKIHALERCGYSYLQENPQLPDSIRIDVIIIVLNKMYDCVSVEHYENIFNSFSSYSKRF